MLILARAPDVAPTDEHISAPMPPARSRIHCLGYNPRPMAKKAQSPPKDFEEAIKELEQILGEIERGEVGLEESLLKYERGNFLIQHCQGILNTAEQQIEVLSKAGSGELKANPLPESTKKASDE